MTIKECYNKLKGDYQDAKSRLGSDELIEKFALMFPKDKTMENLRKAVADGNIEEQFKAAHTLKGLAGNLSFSELAKYSTELTELLRPLKQAADPDLVKKIEELYKLIIDSLEEYEKQK